MRNQKSGRKNKGQIQIAFIAIAAIVVVEGVILTNYLIRSENIVRALREEQIIQAVNNVEFAKRGLSQAVLYSFNQASYDIGKRGGYFNMPLGDSLDCIPYWKTFNSTNIPNFKSELQQNLLKVFNVYGTSLGVDVPQYDNVQFDITNNVMNLTSSGMLTDQEDFFTIKDSANFVQNANMSIFKLYAAAADIENQLDSKVSSSTSYSNALDNVISVSNSMGQKYSSQGFQVTISPSQDLGNGGKNFAIRVLVSVTDTTQKSLVYDFAGKTLTMRNLEFRYYMLFGNSPIQPQVNECAKINY